MVDFDVCKNTGFSEHFYYLTRLKAGLRALLKV